MTDPQTFYVQKNPKVTAPSRHRAGLKFEKTWTKVEIVDEPADVIAAKQLAGAYVVNAEGARAIYDDSGANGGLLVSSLPPPEPLPPPVITPKAADSPPKWLDVATRMDAQLPRTKIFAEPVLRAMLTRRAENASPAVAPLVRRFADLLLAERYSDEFVRLGAALELVDESPAALPPLARRSWATNESAPAWMTLVAAEIGARFDVFAQPGAAELEAVDRAYLDAIKVEGLTLADAPAAKGDPSALETAARAARDAALEEIHKRRNADADTWSERTDAVRMRVVLAIDKAITTAPTALGRFALGELARAGREMPISLALAAEPWRGRVSAPDGPDVALKLVMAEGVRFEPVADAELAAITHTMVRLLVCTKGSIPTRRRAGLTFDRNRREIEVAEPTARALLADDGLIVFPIDGDARPGSLAIATAMNAMDAKEQAAELARARTADIEAELARRRVKPREAGEPRIRSSKRDRDPNPNP